MTILPIAIGAATALICVCRRSAVTAAPSMMGNTEVGFSSAREQLPEIVRTVISKNDASREEIIRAAEAAQSSGYTKLAGALRTRAMENPEKQEERSKGIITSPWQDVPDGAWTRFCRVMAIGNKPDKVDPKGFYGLFQISVRRLCDLGVMRNARSRNAQTSSGRTIRVWEGTWITAMETFLADPKLQYQLFTRSMDLYRSIISERYKQVLGLDIEGRPATLSGLLALAHAAGAKGMYKWLTDGQIRRTFTWVTSAYHHANGIF